MISEKRARVLRRRASLRKAKKAERLEAYNAFLAFAEANPTPKLGRSLRLRVRNALQIAEWGQDTVLMNPKLAAKFGAEGLAGIAERVKEQLGDRLAARALARG